MKRSEINLRIREGIAFFDRMGFKLPPFAFFTREDWQKEAADAAEIFDLQLGWDVTAFGGPDFLRTGLLLFTLRNGRAGDGRYRKPYAEKIMMVRENQVTPCHFHWKKCEDIINRGGGNLMVQVWNATPGEELADTPVTVHLDGVEQTVPAGTVLRLTPGMSITLPQRQYHAFWAERGHGSVLIGEVSMVNDDNTDNRFYETQGRFPTIEEDEPPLYLLCNEYPAAKE